jgi:Maltokinase N-terminal cap domain
MALLHRAELSPSKLELLGGWAPSQPWFDGDGALRLVGAYRLDDPYGQVGIETLLVRAGDGPVLQIPLTYRNDPHEGADQWLIGTMEHSVLGTRWTYDAVGDPVYRDELARTILTGGTEVELWIEIDGVMTRRDPTARVLGSGTESAPDLPRVSVETIRTPNASTAPDDSFVLTGTWAEQPDPLVLAIATIA